MRVLCCLDGTNLDRVSKATELLTTAQPLTIGLIYVTDLGPRHEMEHLRERFHRHREAPPPREAEILQAERASAQAILKEGRSRFPGADTIQREGHPEREIVNTAAEWQADLVIICPRTDYDGKHRIGPKSVGHVARFVVDHAPCPVLLVRTLARDEFPLRR